MQQFWKSSYSIHCHCCIWQKRVPKELTRTRLGMRSFGRKTGSSVANSTSKPEHRCSSESDKTPLPAFKMVPSFRLTESPNPKWRLGEGLSGTTSIHEAWLTSEDQGWKSWNLSEMAPREVYPLLTSAIVPRPIALVSTLSEEGIPNLAPFSYFSMIAHNPPLLSISFSLSPKRPKDTRENIHATKEFTVSIISEAFVEAANVTSVEAPAEVNEWEISGLTMAPSIDVKPPWVKESAVGLECELFHTYDIRPPGKEQVTHTLVLGLIKRIHVRSSVLTSNGTLDPAKLGAVSRLDGKKYARLGEGFELARPSWGDIRAEKQKRSDLSRVKE